MISGEGGIGKSFFIKCFEEKLEKNCIEHLCLYGKFEKDTSRIDINEIINASEKGFVFICDAINEMSEAGQQSLLNILKQLKNNPRIRIVITYRTNSMDEMILQQYQELSEYEYKFPGVSFESALDEILKLSVPDVYLYEDILYSNNALLLSMLCDVLSSEKIVDETENGVASVTFILEHYIKTTIGKVFKNNISCQGIDIWKDTKRVAKWMYMNGEKQIDEKSLLSVINTGDNYLPSMIQIGYEVYDPLEYGEEVIITAPIPTFQDYIERLGDYVINALEQPIPRDINWVKDVELTRRNILHLMETVKVKKQEWVMIAGRISLHEEGKHDTKWRDTYDIQLLWFPWITAHRMVRNFVNLY